MRAGNSGDDWCDFLMSVGNGDAEQDEYDRISIPAEVFSSGNLIGEVFGDQLMDTESLSEKAIIAPFNIEVNRMNEQTLDRLSGQLRQYMSIDDIANDDVGELEYGTEFLNIRSPAGLPPHDFRLKKGSVLMLLRNLDLANGLCNGTRLIVTHFGRLVLGCHFASGERKGKFALIRRIDNFTDKGVPFRLRRRQFPIRLAFAMTINIAQGRSLTHVGVHLQSKVFAHGQLYIALSRARSRAGVKVYMTNTRVKNIVTKAVL
ncbi:hypothetical protein OESDEN_23324 [Oesophagostomum dentatum]|uniref:DNA helicase Pif1-like 2B domain-containing protein n=1 Tax=Oesophagostomum dentatum TaxID=61180 RepID=A0A0B1RZH8_OESDE|nr:hypothetical protein OESDEN_23324 [Oesophagostomum dentatum]